MGILENNLKEMLQNRKKCKTEMKNFFDGLISRLNMTKEKNQWAWRRVKSTENEMVHLYDTDLNNQFI